MTTGVIYANYGAQLTVVGPDGAPSKEKRLIEETGMFFADPKYFRIFKTNWLIGSPEVLDQPNKIVLTKKPRRNILVNGRKQRESIFDWIT